MNFPYLLSYCRFHLAQIGWLATSGLLIAVIAVIVFFAGVAPVQKRATALHLELTQQRERKANQPEPVNPEVLALSQFYAQLPDDGGVLEAISLIHRSAGANAVELANGEYRLVQEASTKVARYQIILPARSSYPRLRSWIAELMNSQPTLALDEISLKRDDLASNIVNARVRLTLYVKGR